MESWPISHFIEIHLSLRAIPFEILRGADWKKILDAPPHTFLFFRGHPARHPPRILFFFANAPTHFYFLFPVHTLSKPNTTHLMSHTISHNIIKVSCYPEIDDSIPWHLWQVSLWNSQPAHQISQCGDDINWHGDNFLLCSQTHSLHFHYTIGAFNGDTQIKSSFILQS